MQWQYRVVYCILPLHIVYCHYAIKGLRNESPSGGEWDGIFPKHGRKTFGVHLGVKMSRAGKAHTVYPSLSSKNPYLLDWEIRVAFSSNGETVSPRH